MSHEEYQRLVVQGLAYVDPSAPPPVLTGTRVQVISQSWSDQTVTALYQQVATLAKRLALMEAHLCVVQAAVEGPGDLF